MPTLRHGLSRLSESLSLAIWTAAVPVVLIAPLLLSVRAGGSGSLLLELGLACGLLAGSLLVIGVVAASRVRALTRMFGIEATLATHRWVGLVATVLAVLHVALVVADDPARNVRLLLFVDAPARARAATVAVVCLLLICITALLRRRLRLDYDVWRYVHVGLAAGALLLTELHVWWLQHLVRDPAMRAWYLGISLVIGLILANRWVIRPLRARAVGYAVEDLRRESASVSTLVLRPRHSWQRGLRFRAGQFAWLRVQGGRWDDHPFTIASNADRPRRLEFTVRHVGDFTTRLRELVPGTRVSLDGPHGAFTVDHRRMRVGPSRTPRLLLVAGGVGITPMMSILRTLAHRGEKLPCLLVLAARTEHDLLFAAELETLSRQLRLDVVPVLSDPGERWPGRIGRVDRTLLADLLPTRRDRALVELFVCGPAAMVGALRAGAFDLGVPAAQVHTEQFDMV